MAVRVLRRPKYCTEYCEDLSLSDGRELRIRPLTREDREELIQGFDRLSPHSRYLRFFTSKHQLESEEIEFLTELDGSAHFALVAVLLESGREEEGVGVARFVRSSRDGKVAEPAITVVDRLQGRGIGRILCERLTEAARERGVEFFECYILAENRKVLQMIRHLFSDIDWKRDGQLVLARIPLGSDENFSSSPRSV